MAQPTSTTPDEPKPAGAVLAELAAGAQTGTPDRGVCCVYYGMPDIDLMRDVIEGRTVIYEAVRGDRSPSIGDLVFVGCGGPPCRVARGTWLTRGVLRLLVVGEVRAIEPDYLRLKANIALYRDVGRELNPLVRDLMAWSASLPETGPLCCDTFGFAGSPADLLTRR